MAFPVVESRNPTVDNDTGGAATTGSTSAASHAVVLPASVSAGALLMIVGRVSTTGAVAVTGGGWTISQSSADAAVGPDVTFWAYRNALAAGTEGGTSVTVTHGTLKLAAQSLSITGAANPADNPPQGASAASSGENVTIDPPALSPAGGPKDFLWIVVGGAEGALATLAKTPPANYANDVDVRTGVAGNNWDNASVHVSTRSLNAATENPGTITTSSADNWLAFTIAVPPLDAAVKSVMRPVRMRGRQSNA